MIIKDLRREFFDTLKGNILIMCALDVDAVCCCKILQNLLEARNLNHSVEPVASTGKLWDLFEEYRDSIDAVITINFGNLINLPELLKPAEGLLFYVIDSHRPINVHNFYKNPQVRLFINSNETELNIPAESKIFLEDESGEDMEQQLSGLLEANANDLTNEQLERRRELKKWLVKRDQLLFDYEEFHFYNRSVALIMYDLAHGLSKNSNYLLWMAILGVTYQFKADKISESAFEKEVERIMRHIARNEVSANNIRGNSWRIRWVKDLQLDLYRQWSLFESLRNTHLTACRFQLWNDKGQRNMKEFLVATGLRVSHSQLDYVCMDCDDRTQLIPAVQNICLGPDQHKYNLQDLIGHAFIMTTGCRSRVKFVAPDVVLAIQAILESHPLSSTEMFVTAINSLTYDKEFHILEAGFEAARTQLKSMFERVRYLITNQKIIDQGSFIFVDLQEEKNLSQDFSRGSSLIRFARFLLNAYVSSKPTRLARRAERLPLVLFSQEYSNPELVLMVGIPPIAQKSKRNFFAKAFQQAAANVNSEIKLDLSESNLVRASINNKNLILEQLKLLLE